MNHTSSNFTALVSNYHSIFKVNTYYHSIKCFFRVIKAS